MTSAAVREGWKEGWREWMGERASECDFPATPAKKNKKKTNSKCQPALCFSLILFLFCFFKIALTASPAAEKKKQRNRVLACEDIRHQREAPSAVCLSRRREFGLLRLPMWPVGGSSVRMSKKKKNNIDATVAATTLNAVRLDKQPARKQSPS